MSMAKTRKPQFEEVTLPLPIDAEVEPIGFGVHINLRLTPAQGSALAQLCSALDKQGATLVNGRRVTRGHGGYNDTVRWLAEQILEKLE